jgi:hypothetical protein
MERMERRVPEPAAFIPVAAPRRGRSRARERGWMLRGIPEEVREQVGRVAGELGVPVYEVVRAFLEEGLRRYRDGSLKLEPAPRAVRFTLFPPGRR